MIALALKKELFGATTKSALEVCLEIEEGEFLAISGASGSGKTTLLRIIAGLEDAKGSIVVSGVEWLGAKRVLPPQKREIGFVFQEYALFENMSVLENLLFVAKERELAQELLKITGMEAFEKRLPRSLSGGQKQRVALARAFMSRPKILLLDEALSALDASMREELQQSILALHKRFSMTTIMVSHDPSEIYKMATRVVLLEKGKVKRDATPKEVLLQTEGSQKFSLRGEIVDILQADVLYVAIVAIGQQIVEIVLEKEEAKIFTIGERVRVSTKAFAPSLSKL